MATSDRDYSAYSAESPAVSSSWPLKAARRSICECEILPPSMQSVQMAFHGSQVVFNISNITTGDKGDSQGGLQPGHVVAVCTMILSAVMLAMTCLKLYYWRKDMRQPPVDREANQGEAATSLAGEAQQAGHDEGPRETREQDISVMPLPNVTDNWQQAMSFAT
ncbi:hypothetical protein B0H21DRAFT_248581 [Amylocystis lapponica]|nr:hypothetical protein B0H21DRAFT_248581 [Amylocystis lapponica]